MKKLFPIVISLVSLFFVIPHTSAALYTGGTVLLDKEVIVPTTIFAEDVRITAPVKSDLTIVASKVEIGSSVSGSTVIAAGTFTSSGSTFASLRLATTNTALYHTRVEGPLMGFAGNMHIDDQSHLMSDVLLFGNEGTFYGDTQGIELLFSKLLLGGKIHGDLVTTSDEIEFANAFSVDKNYTQRSVQETLPPSSTVVGKFEHKATPHIELPKIFPELRDPQFFFLIFFWLLFFNIIFVWFAPDFLCKKMTYMKKHPLESFLTGVSWFIILPLLAVIAALSAIGMYAAFIGIILYAFVLLILPSLLSFFYGSMLLSAWLHEDERPSKMKLIQVAFLGTVTVLLIQLLPVVGTFANILLGTLAVGTLFQNDEKYFGLIKKS